MAKYARVYFKDGTSIIFYITPRGWFKYRNKKYSLFEIKTMDEYDHIEYLDERPEGEV